MSILQAAAICIVGSILCLFLRRIEPAQAALLGLAVLVLVLLSAMPEISRIVQTAEKLFGQSGLEPGWFLILCKAAGITYLTQIGADVCRDCGETAVASAVELCGRISLAGLALPLFVRLAEIVLEVIG